MGPKGILKNKVTHEIFKIFRKIYLSLNYDFKTRLFVTNSLNFLPQMDKIVYIEDGSILEMGTFEELTKYDTLFSKFISTFLQTKQSNTNDICKY
jgi:ABC-type transport system involved in cytochrome bd biosynthesis fused ATPase/permease subunit